MMTSGRNYVTHSSNFFDADLSLLSSNIHGQDSPCRISAAQKLGRGFQKRACFIYFIVIGRIVAVFT
jgi:hypothetical protein